MRKKELLKHITAPSEATAQIIKCGKEKVLMLTYPEPEISQHNTEGFVHFVTKKEYLTYYPSIDLWTRESVESVRCIPYLRSGVKAANFDEVVRDFARKEIRLYTSHIDCIESRIRFKNEMKGINREFKRTTERIQAVTPPLPHGFTDWAKKRKFVKLFQPSSSGGVIERMFVGGGGLTEICRAECEEYGTAWNSWYYGTERGVYGKKQQFTKKKARSVMNSIPLPRKYEVYDNLDSLDMTEAQKSCLRITSGLHDPSIILDTLNHLPELEYVFKSNTRLAIDLMELPYATAKNKISSYIKQPKQKRKKLAEYSGGIYALNLLESFPQISDENLKEFCKIKSYDKARQILYFADEGLNLNHIMTLLKKTGGLKCDNIRRYTDYLAMAAHRGANIHDEIIYRNKRWQEFHDRYVEEANREKMKIKAEQFIGIKRDYEENKKRYAWKGEGFTMLVPRDYLDIVDEGTKQHHCVGASDRYMLKMANRETFILFLRHQDSPQEPYYTIEAKPDGSVIQAYAAYDRKPDYEQVSKILKLWQQEVAKRQKGAKACMR